VASGEVPPEADERAFDAYVPHPISHWNPVLPPPVWQALEDAETAIARAQQVGAAMPAADWILTRSESSGSSLIEGVHASAVAVAHAEARSGDGDAGATTAEALRNVVATRVALRRGAVAAPLVTGDLHDLHTTLMGEAHDAGALRDQQGWIGTALHPTPHGAIHVAPPAAMVPALLDDLLAAANRPTAAPLLQAAIVHAQYITVHPYRDGNGRTGRCLVHLMLRRAGLTPACAPPLSVALAGRRSRYLRALNISRAVCAADDPVRSARMEPWIRLFAETAVAASNYAISAVEHLRACETSTAERLRRGGVRRDNAAYRLLSVLPEHPVIDAASAAGLVGADERTARRSIDLLVKVGALRQVGDARRWRLFEAPAVLESFRRLAEPELDSADLTTTPGGSVDLL
jgi:Fic family protein